MPSPDLKSHLYFNLNRGEPWYLVFHNGEIIVDWSLLGLITKDNTKFTEGLVFIKSTSGSDIQNQQIRLKEGSLLDGPFNELVIYLGKAEQKQVVFKIIFRAYNKGIAIAYDFETHDTTILINLSSEETQFNLYDKSVQWNLSEKSDTLWNDLQSLEKIDFPAVFVSSNGFELTLTESAVNNYPEMNLSIIDPGKPKFHSVPNIPDGDSFIITPGIGSSYKVIRVFKINQPEKQSNELL
jgi:hypothetical protein